MHYNFYSTTTCQKSLSCVCVMCVWFHWQINAFFFGPPQSSGDEEEGGGGEGKANGPSKSVHGEDWQWIQDLFCMFTNMQRKITRQSQKWICRFVFSWLTQNWVIKANQLITGGAQQNSGKRKGKTNLNLRNDKFRCFMSFVCCSPIIAPYASK